MAKVHVNQNEGVIVVVDAGQETEYKVASDGTIEVEGSHLAAVLASVPGAVDLTPPPPPEPEAPATSSSEPGAPATAGPPAASSGPGTPAKEQK